MKIGIPTENDKLCSHFGHCEYFTVFTVENNEITFTEKVQTPTHTPGAYPKLLADNGVQVVLAGGMGQKAQDIFAANNIKTFVGIEGGNVEDLVKDYLAGKIVSTGEFCNHTHDH